MKLVDIMQAALHRYVNLALAQVVDGKHTADVH